MDYIIREIKKEEYDLLNDFLYEAIYIPDGVEPPSKSIINCPELQEYVFEFGKRKDDRALVAEVQGNVVGAIWVRIMNDYGHIDNDTPSLAMSVFQKYRGQGIGTSLLQQLLLVEKSFGYSKISDWSDEMNDIFKDMQEKVGCEYISDLPFYKRKVWHEMKRLNPADYEERQLEDFSKYVFGMSYQTLKDVMKQQKGREEQCRKQGCWWKRKEQLAKKQHHTGSTCR